jgi:hypothetical protein
MHAALFSYLVMACLYLPLHARAEENVESILAKSIRAYQRLEAFSAQGEIIDSIGSRARKHSYRMVLAKPASYRIQWFSKQDEIPDKVLWKSDNKSHLFTKDPGNTPTEIDLSIEQTNQYLQALHKGKATAPLPPPPKHL